MTAQEAMRPQDNPEEGAALGEAKMFLLNLLAKGPVKVKAIQKDAEGNGLAWRTIERAKQALKIEAEKENLEGGWVWYLPRDEGSPSVHKPPSSSGPVPSKTATDVPPSNPVKNNEDRHEDTKAATAKGEPTDGGLGDTHQPGIEAEEEIIDLC
jgi:hypothetical protein